MLSRPLLEASLLKLGGHPSKAEAVPALVGLGVPRGPFHPEKLQFSELGSQMLEGEAAAYSWGPGRCPRLVDARMGPGMEG